MHLRCIMKNACGVVKNALARIMMKAANLRFAAFVIPGGYLLSRDLSSDYHRRADVSLPGSEWDRVGPSGYDHRASDLLRTSYLVVRTSACPFVTLLRGVFMGMKCRLASARQCVFCVEFHVESSLSPGVIHLGCV